MPQHPSARQTREGSEGLPHIPFVPYEANLQLNAGPSSLGKPGNCLSWEGRPIQQKGLERCAAWALLSPPATPPGSPLAHPRPQLPLWPQGVKLSRIQPVPGLAGTVPVPAPGGWAIRRRRGSNPLPSGSQPGRPRAPLAARRAGSACRHPAPPPGVAVAGAHGWRAWEP